MSEEFLKKRITETKTDIFPLDRLLPLETVYSTICDEYAKTKDRNLFFRDRKFQKLREGYFSLFVAADFIERTKKQHFLIFPSSQENDVWISYQKEEKLTGYEFDVKEFTNWSGSFREFFDKNIAKRIDTYNLIIATYRKIDGADFEYIVNHLIKVNTSAQIWIIASQTEEHDDFDVSNVITLGKDYADNKNIDLKDCIDKNKAPVVYQDKIRFIQKMLK